MSTTMPSATGQTVAALRGLILHGLLLILLVLFGTGLSLLLSAALQGFSSEGDLYFELATAISFTIIAGPLAWLLWRAVRGRLIHASPTDAAIWSLQGTAVYLIALITASTSLLQLLAGLVLDQPWFTWQSPLGTAIAWSLVGIWQYRLLHSPTYRPTELPHLAATLGNAYALLLAAWTASIAVSTAGELLLKTDDMLIGPSPIPRMLAAVIWAVGATALWFWHWKVQRVQQVDDAFGSLVLVLAGVCLPALASLLAAAAALNILIPLPWEAAALTARFVENGPLTVAVLLVATATWIYHQAQLTTRPAWALLAARQVVSGIALALLASGLGMVVNALLAAISSPLNSGTAPSVLRTGLGLLLVGVAAWWWFFRPLAPADPESRRIYLVLFFGFSAVVALIALLVIAYRVVEFLLGGTGLNVTMVDYIRGPVGWLVATAAVATYHFVLWRSDREKLHAKAPETDSPVVRSATAAPAGRTVMVVVPAGSDRLLSALQQHGEVRVHWIPAAGPELSAEALDLALETIGERLHHEPGAVLAVVNAPGEVRFTALAGPAESAT